MIILSKPNLSLLIKWFKEQSKDPAIALINKPNSWTSFDIIRKIRLVTGIKKIGHTGTLDPFATGLLIILFNSANKLQSSFLNLDKTYIATIKLGARTRTMDPTSPEEDLYDIRDLTLDKLNLTIDSFIGEYEQVPPIFSAKKVNGRRLYLIARKEKDININIPPHKVKIHSINILSYDLPYVTFEVCCSKGTYIRSLANDIGIRLGVGAYLVELRRTKIGVFFVDNAFDIFEFTEFINNIKLKNENI